MEDEGAAVAQVVDHLEVVDVAVHRVGQLSGTREQRQVVPIRFHEVNVTLSSI